MTSDLQKAIEISIINDMDKLINLINDVQMVQQFIIQYQIGEYPDDKEVYMNTILKVR